MSRPNSPDLLAFFQDLGLLYNAKQLCFMGFGTKMAIWGLYKNKQNP